MTGRDRLQGIWAAVLTPLDEALQPDAAKAIPYYHGLLESGCDGINALGTTGEAMSLSADQRLRYMEALAASGIPADRVMCGTGAASLEDAVRLTRAAFAFGYAAALVMPPFFLRDVCDDGVLAFFDALFSRVQPPARRVLLYNFPALSGITFHPDFVDRLLTEFPTAIAGVKDSSNDLRLQAEMLIRHPDLRVLVGSEEYLRQARSFGAAGCISGSVSLWPELAAQVFATDDAGPAERLAEHRKALCGPPLISAVRYLTAKFRGDASWERSVPPLCGLTGEQKARLDRAFELTQHTPAPE